MATATVTCSITITSPAGSGTGDIGTPGEPNLYLALIGKTTSVLTTALILNGSLTGGIPLDSPDFNFVGAPIMIYQANTGNIPFWTTIASVQDATHATLTDAVPVNVGAVEVDCYFPVIQDHSAVHFIYYVIAGTYDFESSLSTRPTLNFEIFSKPLGSFTQPYIPQVGMPVLFILEDHGDVFGGSIDQVQADNVPGQSPTISKCQCVSWDQALQKRLLMLTGKFSLGTTQDVFTGDGDQALFSLTQPPVNVTAVTLDGVPQTFGINTTTVYLSWNVNNPIVTVFGTPPAAGALLAVTYQAAGAVVAPPIFFNETADAIFLALVNTIALSEGLSAKAVAGPLVNQIVFTSQDTVASAIAALVTYINNGGTDFWYWTDPRKQVHFDIQGVTQLAPWNISTLDASDRNVLINISLSTTREQFANAAWADIAAATGLSTLTETFPGDATTRTFTSNFPISRVASAVRIFNDGTTMTTTPQELLVTGQTPVNPADAWFFDLNQTTITEGPGNTTLRGGGPISAGQEYLSIVYYPSASVTQQYINSASLAERHLIEGGSGETDLYINLGNTNVILATATIAQNYATYYAQMAQRLNIVTYRAGLKTGQGILVNLPEINASGSFIVDQVRLVDENNVWKWSVSCAAGAIVGDWKRAMVRLANLL